MEQTETQLHNPPIERLPSPAPCKKVTGAPCRFRRREFMLSEEISSAQRSVRTDAYQMSIGEVVGMYEAGDLVIDPEFQRLFR